MVSGFALGGFGKGLASGVSAGTALNKNTLDARNQELESRKQAAELGMNGFKSLKQSFTDAVPVKGQEAVLSMLTSSNVIQGLTSIANNISLGTGQKVTPEMLLKTIEREIRLAASPTETGAAQGQTRASSAEAELGRPLTDPQKEKKLGVDITPEDTTKALDATAKTASLMLNRGIPADNVREMVLSIAQASNSGKVQAGLRAIAEAIPTDDEISSGLAGRDQKKRALRETALIEAGVSPKLAAIFSQGGGANVDLDPEKLGKAELASLRTRITDATRARKALADLKPKLTDDVMGVWGRLRDTDVAGIATQIPVIKQIASALGFSEEKVNQARAVRSEIRTRIAQLTRFITDKGNRIAVTDRDFATEALRLLDAATTATAAQDIIDRMNRIADQVIADNGKIIAGGKAGGAPSDIDVVPNAQGGFDVIQDGKIINTLDAQ